MRKTIKVGTYSRTIQQVQVSFVCERCGTPATHLQFPGRTPKYCEDCRADVQRERARETMRRARAKHE
jgi:hypothetical protein